MRFLQEVPKRVHALIASAVLGAVVVSLTPGFANTTATVLQRPDDGLFLGRSWLTLFDVVPGTKAVERATIDLSANRLAHLPELNRVRRRDELSEQDVYRYEIDLPDAWNATALTGFFENVESTTRLRFGQVMTSADGKASASASTGMGIELRRDDAFEMGLEAEALYFEAGSRNDDQYESQWLRGRTTANVLPWSLGEHERLGFGLRGTGRYNTPTGTERDLWVHVGPVLRLGSDSLTVDFLVGYYTSYEELDDDIPQQYSGVKREHLDFAVDSSGVTSRIEIVKEFASGVSLVVEGGAQLDSDRIRQAGGRTSVRVPLIMLFGRSSRNARAGSASSRVSIQIGVEGRHFDLGSRHALPFHEEMSGTFSLVYALR